MNHFDWTSTIRPNLFVLRCVGLWPEKDKLYELNSYTIYAVMMSILIIGGHNLFQIMNIYFVYDDLEILTETIFVLITNVMATAKIVCFVYNLRTLKYLFKVLDSSQFQPKSLQQMVVIEPSLKRWKTSYIIYQIVVGTNVVLWSIGPLLNDDQDLPFLSWYPFCVEKSPNHEIVYCYQLICIWFITAANLNLDSLTYAVFMYIWIQCDILCDDLCNLRDDPTEFNRKLVECIKHHKNIVEFAKEYNRLINLIVLGQFATSTLVLALTMFQLSLTDPTSGAAFAHLNYITGISMELFLYCWFGNEIEIKSCRIPYAVYKSHWLEQPEENKKNILILNTRCQKPIKMTAIDLFALSLKTFVAILRTAWSYFALLYNINNA